MRARRPRPVRSRRRSAGSRRSRSPCRRRTSSSSGSAPRDRQPVGLRLARPAPVLLPPLHRPAAAEAADPRQRAGRRGRGGRVRASAAFEAGDEVFGDEGGCARRVRLRRAESAALAHKPAGMTFEEAAAVCDGAINRARRACAGRACGRGRSIVVYGSLRGRLRTAGVQRGQALRRRWHGRVQHVVRRCPRARSSAVAVIDCTREQASPCTASPTTSCPTPSAEDSLRRSRRSLRAGGRPGL